MTNLPPGPELDRLIAEKVMGWTNIRKMNACDWYSARVPGRADTVLIGCDSARGFVPSTNIAHAWGVVEKLREDYSIELDDVGSSRWGVTLRRFEQTQPIRVIADTAPLAICRAAVRAAGHS